MKKLIYFLTISLFLSCNSSESFSSKNRHPEFKTSKNALETRLNKTIKFEKLGVGTYMSNKENDIKQKGISLTFYTNEAISLSDSLLLSYSDIIVADIKKDLLNLDDYDLAIIKFQNKITEGEFIKSNSVQINKKLK